MDYGELYRATKDAFTEALAEHKTRPRLMRVDPFDAEDEDGKSVRVIGVIDDDDMVKFLVIEEDEDGAIFPAPCSTVYRKGAAGQ
ncbi:hypothetical protein IE4771_CH01956 [Rhizobium etli bv. mimosae str. IE4771]|uniref:Uncharacterized protein n=1 Tax=Rhizobium etli bv. mimosae str. IE4771 TaxID=1432050 RepID=A0A060HVU9_RHIET|nr:hypothetical protein [Rhizobium sp. IE4771]AIC27073.1 hypothetical protein IE4771_CH01956 [Rhizobium sp. IE4771]